MKTLSGREALKGSDSGKHFFWTWNFFFRLLKELEYSDWVTKQKGCDVFCNATVGLFWISVWQLFIVCTRCVFQFNLSYGLSAISVEALGSPPWLSAWLRSVGGYLTLCVFTATALALSAVWSLHAQSPDLSRVTPKDSDRHSANHPVDLKYRPATKSHYTQ